MHEHHKHYYTWMRISLRPNNRSRIRTNVKSVFYTFTIPFLKIILYKSPKGRKKNADYRSHKNQITFWMVPHCKPSIQLLQL